MRPWMLFAAALTVASAAHAKTLVIPHVLEKSGLTSNSQYSFDTMLYVTYVSGLGGTPVGPGASVDLYLYDNNGAPWVSATGRRVCDPCVIPIAPLQGSPPKVSVSLDSLVTGAGGFPRAVMTGFAVLVVNGQDPDGVNLSGFILNSHTSAFDLTMTPLDIQPVVSAP